MYIINFKLLLFQYFLLTSGLISYAFGQEILNSYIKEGLQNNLSLQQKNVDLEKSYYALKISKSYFIPSINLQSGYTSGEGGRSIALPVGDMLNPVYATLNQLTESNNFPQINNVNQNFFPKNFIDAHVRTSLPILNTDLLYDNKIQEDKIRINEYELKAFQRELVFKIKLAYFDYLSAIKTEEIYASALALVQQNLRLNQSLLNNGSGLHASVLRVESEMENVKSQLYTAQNNVMNAQRYFNFLLNRPLKSGIDILTDIDSHVSSIPAVISDTNNFQVREEIKMLNAGYDLSLRHIKKNQWQWAPKINAFLDLGAQSENWRWNKRSRYYLVGITLDLPLFNGFRNKYLIRQGLLSATHSLKRMEETRMQIQMTEDVSKDQLSTEWQNFVAAGKRLSSSGSYFRLIEKGYTDGANTLIEFIDARNQLTLAELQISVQKYQLMKALAQYERETSSYIFNEKQ